MINLTVPNPKFNAVSCFLKVLIGSNVCPIKHFPLCFARETPLGNAKVEY